MGPHVDELAAQRDVDLIEVATFLGERYGTQWETFLRMPLLLIWAYYEWGHYYRQMDLYERMMLAGAGSSTG